MSAKCFVDTNVLVYAHQANAGTRHRIAADLVEQLWRQRTGVLSTQVLQELYINLRKKIDPALGIADASHIIDDYLAWRLVINDGESIRQAIDFEKRYKLSFWDALVIHAASVGDADTLYSEDFNDGQRYGRVTVVNPFV